MQTIYATLDGKKQLQQKLESLIAKRQDISAQIREAREFGDLRENAEYAAAREAQNNLEMEISEIEAMLPNIKMFTYAKADTGSVNIGTKVTVEIVATKAKMDFVITGILENDFSKGFLSNESPVGSALLGAKVGDVVAVKVPVGTVNYKVLAINKVA